MEISQTSVVILGLEAGRAFGAGREMSRVCSFLITWNEATLGGLTSVLVRYWYKAKMNAPPVPAMILRSLIISSRRLKITYPRGQFCNALVHNP